MKRLSMQEAQAKLGLILADSNMQELYRRAYRLANQGSNVLLLGDSGTGKDMLARFIHSVSKRSHQPFVQINCSSIPDALFESEVFGHVPGAFSEASPRGKRGLAEAANYGVLFLDEIGELNMANQVKLLHFLQSGEIRPLGSEKVIKLDVTIIAATNRNLRHQIRQKQFRQDLYYRICVVTLEIPPLHKRPHDIMMIAQNIMGQYAAEYAIHKTLTPDALRYLCSQRWSGNVRQLQNYIQRLCLLDTPLEINAQYLEHTSPVQNLFSDAQEQTHPRMVPLTQAMASFEKQYIQTALDQADSLVEAAQMLGIPLSTLNRKKKYHGLYRYPRYEGEYH